MLEILELQAEVRQNAKQDRTQCGSNVMELMDSSPTSDSSTRSMRSGVKRKSHVQEEDPFIRALMMETSGSDGQDQYALQRRKLELDEKRLNADIMLVRFPISALSVNSWQPILEQLQIRFKELSDRTALERLRLENNLKIRLETLASEERREANQQALMQQMIAALVRNTTTP